ncbi:MAG: glycerophosphodiester phosphodiesterase [Chloroflexi bacterium]|nr:glycerophosphodiester phosphodiesterase [Chloroflexota bacterium]
MPIPLLRAQTGRMLVESHRGADRLAPENSWTAIELGYKSGADFVEIDVQQTADSELVIYHNYRAPDGQLIRAMRRNDVSLVCAGENHLIGLDDLFEWAAGNDCRFALDIKNGFDFDRGVFARALALVEQYGFVGRAVFVAWDHAGLRFVKERNPQATTRAILRGRPVNLVDVVQAARADAVSLSYDLASAEDVQALHAAGIAVMVADLFEPDFGRVAALDADAVTYGDPILAIRALRELGAR